MFGNTVQNDLALVEQIKMIVNYLRGLVLLIVILLVSVPQVPTGSTVQSPNKGQGPFLDFVIFLGGGPSYFAEKCDDCGEN